MKILTSFLLLISLFSCGSAKTMYADTKYDLCAQKCDLKFSKKYDGTNYYKCIAECNKKKYEDAKTGN